MGVCRCKKKDDTKLKVVARDEAPTAPPRPPPSNPPLILTHKSSSKTRKEALVSQGEESSSSQQTVIPVPRKLVREPSADTLSPPGDLLVVDPTIASYTDVAVIRALLVTHWFHFFSDERLQGRGRNLLGSPLLAQPPLGHPCLQGTRRNDKAKSLQLAAFQRQEVLHVSCSKFCRTKKSPQQDCRETSHQAPTWADLQLEETRSNVEDVEETHRLKVAFRDERRKSNASQLSSVCSRRSSLNAKRERNKSDPSLNNSLERLSPRERTGSSSLAETPSQSEKKSERLSSQFYPEAQGSAHYIEKDGRLSFSVLARTLSQLVERVSVVRVCELALNMADLLLRVALPLPSEEDEPFFANITATVLRVFLSLGCPHGCNDEIGRAHV